MRQAVVLVIVTTLCTDASARRLPKNVQLLERPGGTGGKASFDGKWYAYWAFTNKRLRRIGLKLYSIPGRKVVLTVPCSKDRANGLAGHFRQGLGQRVWLEPRARVG